VHLHVTRCPLQHGKGQEGVDEVLAVVEEVGERVALHAETVMVRVDG
jgi:hypothetical protein